MTDEEGAKKTKQLANEIYCLIKHEEHLTIIIGGILSSLGQLLYSNFDREAALRLSGNFSRNLILAVNGAFDHDESNPEDKTFTAKLDI